MKPLFLLAALALSAAASVVNAQEKTERVPEDASFSPSMKQIVYADAIRREGEVEPTAKELWVIDSDGQNARRLTKGGNDANPRFSPDGKRIAFARNNDIWTIDADGSDAKALAETKQINESKPVWTNDGKELIYLSDKLEALGGMDDVMFSTGARVAARDIASGKERIILDTGFNVGDLALSTERDDLAYIRATKIGKDGKAIDSADYKPAIATLDLKTGKAEAFYEIDEKKLGARTLESLDAAAGALLIFAANASYTDSHVALVRNGAPTLLPDLAQSGTLSPDGKTIVTQGMVGAGDTQRGLKIYDIEQKKFVANLVTGITDAKLLEAQNHLIRGNALADAGDQAAAIAEFSKAVELAPKSVDALYARGASYEATKDFPRALADFSAVIALQPDSGFALVHRAAIYVAQGDDEKARADYSAALLVLQVPSQKVFVLRKNAELQRKAGMEELAMESESAANFLELPPEVLAVPPGQTEAPPAITEMPATAK